MSDWADKAVERQGRQGHRRADPLEGVDIDKEYKLIKMDLCKFSPRIQALILKQWELNKWKS